MSFVVYIPVYSFKIIFKILFFSKNVGASCYSLYNIIVGPNWYFQCLIFILTIIVWFVYIYNCSKPYIYDKRDMFSCFIVKMLHLSLCKGVSDVNNKKPINNKNNKKLWFLLTRFCASGCWGVWVNPLKMENSWQKAFFQIMMNKVLKSCEKWSLLM